MGENLVLPERLSVRTPMQWTDQKNGGFSPVAPGRLVRPIPEGRFGPLAVNVASQRRDPDSLLNWFERMIRRRRETFEIGAGALTILDTGDDAVLAHRLERDGMSIVAVHNLSPEPRMVKIGVGSLDGCEVSDLLDGGAVPDFDLKLDGYCYRWFRIQPADVRTAP